jgi:hypothetical protein
MAIAVFFESSVFQVVFFGKERARVIFLYRLAFFCVFFFLSV